MTIQDFCEYKQPIERFSRDIETCVDNWEEVGLKHPIICPNSIYMLANSFDNAPLKTSNYKLKWIERVYIAKNGLLRLAISEEKPDMLYRNTIAVHVKDNECFIIVSDRHRKYIDEVIEFIEIQLKRTLSYFEKNDDDALELLGIK